MAVNTSMSGRIIKGLLGIVLAIAGIAAFFPFVYMILLSFTQSESLNFQWDDLAFNFVNYEKVFVQTPFFSALRNSLIVSFCACTLNMLVSSMAAYGLEKKVFRGRKFIFGIYLATLAVPGQVTLIPVFTLMRNMGMLDTYPALILPILNAFGVFLVKQFMTSVPDELLEAAQIDGAGEIRTFTGIVLPLIKPVLVSLTVFTFISTWNDFLWPLVVTSSEEMRTLTVALSLLKGQFTTNYGLVMAGSVMTFIFPFTLYIILQKQFVEGIALSGIKG